MQPQYHFLLKKIIKETNFVDDEKYILFEMILENFNYLFSSLEKLKQKLPDICTKLKMIKKVSISTPPLKSKVEW